MKPIPRKKGNYPVIPRVPRVKNRNPLDGKTRVNVRSILFRDRVFCMERVKPSQTYSAYTFNKDKETALAFSDVRTFTYNKDWRTLVSKGLDASSPYSRTGGWVTPCTWRGTVDGPTTESKTTGSGYASPTLTALDNTVLKNAALGRLKHRLNGYIGNAQLAAPLAEAREIGKTVRQINSLGMDAVRAMLLARKTHGRSIAKLLANIWLGYGFGIKPLLKDLQSAADAILDYQTREDKHVRVSGTASMDYRTTSSGGRDIATGMDIGYKTNEHHIQSVRYVAGLKLQLRSTASYSVTDHCGLEISEIPGAIWELVPFSWAIDYFTTVSPWLDDTFFTLPGVTKYVTLTEKHYVEAQCFAYPIPASSAYKWIGGMGPGKHIGFSLVRTPLASLPSRSLRIKTLDEVGLAGMHKLLNLASVLAQLRF